MLQIEDPKVEIETRAGLLRKLNEEIFGVKFEYSKPKQIQGLEGLETEEEGVQVLGSKLGGDFERVIDGDFALGVIYGEEDLGAFVKALDGKMDGAGRAEMQGFLNQLAYLDGIGEEMKGLVTRILGQMPEDRMRKIDFGRVSEKYWSVVFEWVAISAEVLDLEQYPEWLTKYAQSREAHELHSLDPILTLAYKMMTLAQLEKFLELNPKANDDSSFIKSMFAKKWPEIIIRIDEKLENFDAFRAMVNDMITWISGHDSKIRNSIPQLRKMLLVHGAENGHFDIELLKEYIECPETVESFYNMNHQQTCNVRYGDYIWQDLLFNQEIKMLRDTVVRKFKVGKIGEWGLIKLYLEEEFKTSADFNFYKKYFATEKLNNLFYEVKLKTGQKIAKIGQIFSEKTLESIRCEKILAWARGNQKYFTSDQEIKFKIQLKNITKVTVNIFQVNTENYYRKNKKEIPATIDLEGLMSAKTQILNLPENPILLTEKEITLEGLGATTRGVYIVELIGGGISTRVMIKKGSLTLVSESAKGMTMFFVLNEKKEVCKEQTSIILNDRVYKASADDGKICVHLESYEVNSKAIIINNDFSDIADVRMPLESYDLSMNLCFNEERLLPGTTCEFLLPLKLTCVGKRIPLTHLKGAKLTVNCMNESGVKSEEVYKDLKLSAENDLIVKYMVPTKASELNFTFTAKLQDSNKKDVDLNQTALILVDTFKGSNEFNDSYLRNTADGYVIDVLGKNGEPIPKTQFAIKISKRPVIDHESLPIALQTDSNGQMFLGKLPMMKTIELKPKDGYRVKVWNLEDNSLFQNLPSQFHLATGEVLKLPMSEFDEFNRQNYSLFKCYGYDVNENCSHHLSNVGGLVLISGELPEGKYRFYYSCSNFSKRIDISIRNGNRWNYSKNWLVEDTQVMRLKNQNKYLIYDKLEVSDSELKVRILSNNPGQVKVHLLAFNYLPSQVDSKLGLYTKRLEEANLSKDAPEVYKLKQNSNTYLDSKKLSDEIQYVLDRKNKRTYIGNTLDKPQSILNHQFNKTTSQDVETLKVGEKWADEAPQTLARAVVEKRSVYGAHTTPIKVEQLYGFLVNNGLVLSNLKPNSGDKSDEISIPLKEIREANFSNVMLLVSDNHSQFSKTIS